MGSLLSENLGLALGAAALALLWDGVQSGRRWLLALGLFTLALALNARAGAFFALPALVIWLVWREQDSWAKSDDVCLGGRGAGLLGFVPSAVLGLVYAPDGEALAFGLLRPFEENGISLTRIDSRPSKQKNGLTSFT